MKIEPMPGTILVQLPTSEFGDIPTPEKAHDSLTYGTVVAMHPNDLLEQGFLVGRTAYWAKYKDDSRISGAAEKLCFIKLSDVLGSNVITGN